MREIKAILFDLDGTLLDTLTDLADSMNSVLARLDLPTHPREAYRYFVGDGMDLLATRVLPDGRRSPALIQRCAEEMRAEYLGRWAVASRPYPGVPELLNALEGRGLRLTILSNKPEEFTRMMVNHLLPGWPWSQVRGERADTPRKPDPSGALAIAEALHLDPGHFLYLGDTNIDMRTATASGMYPIGALWGFRTQAELEEAGAKSLIAHPLEVLEVYERVRGAGINNSCHLPPAP